MKVHLIKGLPTAFQIKDPFKYGLCFERVLDCEVGAQAVTSLTNIYSSFICPLLGSRRNMIFGCHGMQAVTPRQEQGFDEIINHCQENLKA